MPDPYYADASTTVYAGDCLEVLPTLPDNSVDAVCTDPPYALNFMGRSWDKFAGYVERNGSSRAVGDDGGRHDEGYRNMRGREHEYQAWCEQWAAECLRILKPGGHLLAFGGTRTAHRLACAIEDAGFEIRDSIAFMYGAGFPKSLAVGRAIDGKLCREAGTHSDDLEHVCPATPEGEPWRGHGTALKPGHEPIIVARKPLVGTVATNVLQWGTGALNIDAARIDHDAKSAAWVAKWAGHKGHPPGDFGTVGSQIGGSPAGRWPANVVLDESQAAALDQMSGELTSGNRAAGDYGLMGYQGADVAPMPAINGDSGGASRFFYTAKASADERVFYWRASCNCETVKPCEETSPPRDIADSESATDRSWNTSSFGNRPTDDQSHPDMTSITETSTSSTMTPPISSSSPSLSTNASTRAANSETANGGNPAASARNSSPSPSSTGTSAPKAGLSTAAAAPATSRRWSETSKCDACGAPAKREQHATVKPLDLMRWLVRLVTPKGGLILDPFAGSGTTVEAAILEGFRCIAIEREADYLPLITQRINRRRDPIAYLTTAGEDLGLFGDGAA